MIYTTGTIAISGNTLTGTGTNFTAAGSLIRNGCTVIAMTSPVQVFQITTIGSATSLTVTPAANPAVPAGTRFAILLSDSLSVDGLAQDIAETFTMYQRYMSGFADVMNGATDVTITINGTAITVPGQKSLAKRGEQRYHQPKRPDYRPQYQSGWHGRKDRSRCTYQSRIRNSCNSKFAILNYRYHCRCRFDAGAFGRTVYTTSIFDRRTFDRTQFYGATQGNGSNPVAQRMGMVLAYAGGSYACAIAAALDTNSPTIWFRGMAGGTAGSRQSFIHQQIPP